MVGETITLEKIRRLPSRTGRELQVYEHGRRQVVGCIPYRIVPSGRNLPELRVLMVSSQKGTAMMFPKGGWESDESIEQAAIRESLEEAGVEGNLESKLGQWRFKSKSQDKFHDGHIFPMHVSKMYDHWPEKSFRQRKWVKAEEAMKICPYSWMKEALDTLINRLSQLLDQPAENGGYGYDCDGGNSGRFSDGAASWRKNIHRLLKDLSWKWRETVRAILKSCLHLLVDIYEIDMDGDGSMHLAGSKRRGSQYPLFHSLLVRAGQIDHYKQYTLLSA